MRKVHFHCLHLPLHLVLEQWGDFSVSLGTLTYSAWFGDGLTPPRDSAQNRRDESDAQ